MFIVITGGDKCGKTTQCGLLAGRLREYGAKVFEAEVPDYDTPIGKDIKFLLNNVSLDKRIIETMLNQKVTKHPREEQRRLEAMFIIDRGLTEQKIVRAEAEGSIVVCSRWVESAYAYASACGFREDWQVSLLAKSRIPDLTILLDVAASIYTERVPQPGIPDLYDHDSDLQKHVRAFLRDYPDIIKVDGSRPSNEVAESVWKVVVCELINNTIIGGANGWRATVGRQRFVKS